MRLSNNAVIGINSHKIENNFVHIKIQVYKNINSDIKKFNQIKVIQLKFLK